MVSVCICVCCWQWNLLSANSLLFPNIRRANALVLCHDSLFYCSPLQARIKTAKRRVVMASLYLGTGQLEQELVRSLCLWAQDLLFLNGSGLQLRRVKPVVVLVRWKQWHPSTDTRQMTRQEMPENVSQSRRPRETTLWSVQHENALQASYKEWPQNARVYG